MIKIGDIVLYQHRGKHRLNADQYSAEGTVVRIGRRITIRLARTGQLKAVSPDNLIVMGILRGTEPLGRRNDEHRRP